MNTTEHLLCVLAEEAAELAQAAMKAARFGLDDRYPESGITTAAKIIAEHNDVMGVICMLKQRGLISQDIYGELASRARVEKWIEYSRKKGTLRDDSA